MERLRRQSLNNQTPTTLPDKFRSPSCPHLCLNDDDRFAPAKFA